MKELFEKLPSNPFNDFIVENFEKISALYDTILKFIIAFIPEKKEDDAE